jgi:BirA family biotin operon repressor/biotin-[acetyl-CoA-carboxylase] ligase
MQIIKLNATDSTNLFVKELMKSQSLEDYTVVVTKNQTLGRGQMGTRWESEPGKNLTFSILKRFDSKEVNQPFILNICVSLAIYSVLDKLQIPELKVKWPNDILSGTSKICGILIENMLAGNRLLASVIGIGLNVNQVTFADLPHVSSLKLLTGNTFNLDTLLQNFQAELKQTFLKLDSLGSIEMQRNYEKVLFRKDVYSTFKDSEGHKIAGFIQGVSKEGRLVVALDDGTKRTFNMKEIIQVY